jgi:hypothetical protein
MTAYRIEIGVVLDQALYHSPCCRAFSKQVMALSAILNTGIGAMCVTRTGSIQLLRILLIAGSFRWDTEQALNTLRQFADAVGFSNHGVDVIQ